jgi:hypothetical protein
VATPTTGREAGQTWSFRGSKSRNKVTVGEPAVGSLLYPIPLLSLCNVLHVFMAGSAAAVALISSQQRRLAGVQSDSALLTVHGISLVYSTCVSTPTLCD